MKTMMKKLVGLPALALALVQGAGMAPADAQAQTYQWRDNTGRAYISSQPCKPGMVYYAPLPERPVAPIYIPSVGDAPEHLKYMDPRCASLNDAIRTAPARGLKGDVVSDMRKEYNRECRESEMEASRRLSQEKGDKRKAADTEKKVAEREASWTKAQQEMCGELKRVLRIKQARTDLNEGEQRDLQRSQEAYQRRCG
ncbi:MAG: DUF4124 domain-containing protein [Ramlibacter sp.]|nr:DUF4124 domain-containing protein [Ramlibacter sp.]